MGLHYVLVLIDTSMDTLNKPSVYDDPRTMVRIARMKERWGLTGPRVLIGGAWMRPMPKLTPDQRWVQRALLP